MQGWGAMTDRRNEQRDRNTGIQIKLNFVLLLNIYHPETCWRIFSCVKSEQATFLIAQSEHCSLRRKVEVLMGYPFELEIWKMKAHKIE